MKKLFILFLLALSVFGQEVGTLDITSRHSQISKVQHNEDTVYITKSGKKFHTANCRTLKKSKIAISRANATSKGYTACKVCKP